MGKAPLMNSASGSNVIIENRGMSESQAASYLGIPQNTLRQGRCNGQQPGRMPPPPYVKLGKRIIYLIDDLDTYLEKFRVEPETKSSV